MRLMAAPRSENATEKYALDGGMGKDGSVTAIVVARHAATDGYEKGHSSSMVMMQGYAFMKRMNIAGATKTATSVPMPWAIHC